MLINRRAIRRLVSLFVVISTCASILIGVTRPTWSTTLNAESLRPISWAEQFIESWEAGGSDGPAAVSSRDRPLLLVIFTSFDERVTKPYKILAHRLAVRNWAHFIPLGVRPVLFIGEGDGKGGPTPPANASLLEREARAAGWDVLPQSERNYHGTPKLKAMFRCVFDRYPNSTFYGFSNGDILFSSSLTRTLRGIRRITPDLNDNILIMGRRANVDLNLNESETFNPPLTPTNFSGDPRGINSEAATAETPSPALASEVGGIPTPDQRASPTDEKGVATNISTVEQHLPSKYDVTNLDALAKKAKIFSTDAIDYFFFTRPPVSGVSVAGGEVGGVLERAGVRGCSLNWTLLADVVIGRPAYDNYLVAMAIKMGVNVINATPTLLALHLSTPGLMYEGQRNQDKGYNPRVIGPFKYTKGFVTAAKLVTRLDATGQVVVMFK